MTGTIHGPETVASVVDYICKVRGVRCEDLTEAVYHNYRRLFSLWGRLLFGFFCERVPRNVCAVKTDVFSLRKTVDFFVVFVVGYTGMDFGSQKG